MAEGGKVFRQVADLMVTDMATAAATDNVESVARLMREKNTGSVLILEDGKLLGIVTDRDMAIKVVGGDFDAANTPVSDVMTRGVITVKPETSIVDAAKILEDRRIKKLPVTKDGVLVGLITEANVMAALHLKVLAIEPTQEESDGRNPSHYLEDGVSYLVEGRGHRGFEIFVDMVMQGMHGLCITRDHPKRVEEKYQLKETPVIWLTDVCSEHKCIPADSTHISMLITDFLSKSDKPIILLHGLDYMVNLLSFEEVIQLVQHLRDYVAEKGGNLIIPYDKDAVDGQQHSRLQHGMKLIGANSKDTHAEVSPPDDVSVEILREEPASGFDDETAIP